MNFAAPVGNQDLTTLKLANFNPQAFKKFLIEKYPSLANFAGLEHILDRLVSTHHIKLPTKVLTDIRACINDIRSYAFSEKNLEDIKKHATEHEIKILNAPAPQKSALSAFDFHYDFKTEQLSLIEVNTNASAYLVSCALYEFLERKFPIEEPEKNLLKSFQNEMELFDLGKDPKTFIIDEKLNEQKMFFEFFIYKDFLEQISENIEICDFSKVQTSDQSALIYNRYCDFLLTRPESKTLLNHFLEGSALITPNPKEYLITAAKDRLNHFAAKKISSAVIPSIAFQDFNDIEELWSQRKKYYFKPMRMFGGKAVFRGSSISRKRFDSLNFADYMAQESRPPSLIDDWKFDLRVYTYGNQIQHVISRTFKGQLLNFSHEGGGLTTVEFLN